MLLQVYNFTSSAIQNFNTRNILRNLSQTHITFFIMEKGHLSIQCHKKAICSVSAVGTRGIQTSERVKEMSNMIKATCSRVYRLKSYFSHMSKSTAKFCRNQDISGYVVILLHM